MHKHTHLHQSPPTPATRLPSTAADRPRTLLRAHAYTHTLCMNGRARCREFERSEAEKLELERQAGADIRRRAEEDVHRTAQFKREEDEFQKRSEYYSDSINKELAHARDANEFDKMVVHNTYELEQQTSLLHMQETTEADELRRRELAERQRIIDCQSTNTLGLLSAANTAATGATVQAVAPVNIGAGESAHAWSAAPRAYACAHVPARSPAAAAGLALWQRVGVGVGGGPRLRCRRPRSHPPPHPPHHACRSVWQQAS